MSDLKKVLSLLTHPDDAEFVCAGTLALLHQRGWEIHIATMTPGDCGSTTLGPNEIGTLRRREARNAAAVLGGVYHCLESRDGSIQHDPPTVKKAAQLIRTVQPSIVLTASPVDYLYDHEATSLIAREAVFWSTVPNLKTGGIRPLASIPHLYYADPMEGTDAFGRPIMPFMVVDISSVIDTKADMLCCHESQRDWLLQQHGIDEYVRLMKTAGQARGGLVDRAFGEGFRQHLGHAYPKTDLLSETLQGLVHPVAMPNG
jgi:LmbE family N-acetylglucosaminyl deacetylase